MEVPAYAQAGEADAALFDPFTAPTLSGIDLEHLSEAAATVTLDGLFVSLDAGVALICGWVSHCGRQWFNVGAEVLLGAFVAVALGWLLLLASLAVATVTLRLVSVPAAGRRGVGEEVGL